MAGSLQSQDSILLADYYQLKPLQCIFMKSHIVGIILGIILGVPAVTLGSSFTYSLIQGQSPSEAIATIGDQLNTLFGRVDSIEAEQQVISDRLDALEKDDSAPVLKEVPVVIQSEQDLQFCAEMKESLAEISTSLQEKKALLKQVKSMGREEVSEDDYQTQLKETAAKKNSLEGNITQLEIRQKELVENIKQESCI